jgi:hypothetical protein
MTWDGVPVPAGTGTGPAGTALGTGSVSRATMSA